MNGVVTRKKRRKENELPMTKSKQIFVRIKLVELDNYMRWAIHSEYLKIGKYPNHACVLLTVS